MSGTYKDPRLGTTFTFIPYKSQWDHIVLVDGSDIRWVEKHVCGSEKGNYRVWGGGWFIPKEWKINDSTEYTLKSEVHIYPDSVSTLLKDGYDMVKDDMRVERIVYHLQGRESAELVIKDMVLITKKLMHNNWKLVEENDSLIRRTLIDNLIRKTLTFERLPPPKTPPPPFNKQEKEDRYWSILNKCFKKSFDLEEVTSFTNDMKDYLDLLKEWSISEGRDYLFIQKELDSLEENYQNFIRNDEKREMYWKAKSLGDYLC